MGLDEINENTVTGLKAISKVEVGISVNKRTEDTRVFSDVKEVITSLRAVKKCSVEVHRLEGLNDAIEVQRGKQELKIAREGYFRAVRMQKQKVHDQRGRRLH